mgnify:CR=1 FL=1|jgi:hypothetical protein
MNKNELLDACKAVLNSRGQHYGNILENHKRIAEIWSIILGFKVTEEQVLLMMIGLKVARLIQTPDHQDSIIDTAGYAAALSELIEEKKKNQTKPQPEGYLWHKN